MMPTAALRYCTQLGCPVLVQHGRCETHQIQHVRTYDRYRGTAAQRGYNAKWGHYRKWFLEQWSLCGDRPLSAPETQDSQCRAQGLWVKANVVDHIVPVTGPEDPSFYRQEGLQSLCASCHDAKRQRESVIARTSH